MTNPSECRWLFARLDEDDSPPAHIRDCEACARRWRDAQSGRQRMERIGLELSGIGNERLPDSCAWDEVLSRVYESVAEPEDLGSALRSVPPPDRPFPTAAQILRAAGRPSPSLERAIEETLAAPVPTPGWLRARVRAALGAHPSEVKTIASVSQWRRYARAAAVLLVAGVAGFAAWRSISSEHRNSPRERGTLPQFEVVYVDAEQPFDSSFAFHAALESLTR